jgi:hypothetical protein
MSWIALAHAAEDAFGLAATDCAIIVLITQIE